MSAKYYLTNTQNQPVHRVRILKDEVLEILPVCGELAPVAGLVDLCVERLDGHRQVSRTLRTLLPGVMAQIQTAVQGRVQRADPSVRVLLV